MLPSFSGWNRIQGAGYLTLVPRDVPDAGAIRYRERLRPLRSVSELVRDMLARHRGFAADEVGPVDPIVTVEGEYGAFVPVRGRVGDRPVWRDVGFVFGDDFYAQVTGLCTSDAQALRFRDAVRTLTLRVSLSLGVRRRRFLYAPPSGGVAMEMIRAGDPPSGWHGLARGFQTDWVPLDYPRAGTQISVFPANPSGADPDSVAKAIVADDRAEGFLVAGVEGPTPTRSRGGLVGARYVISGEFPGKHTSSRDLVVYQDRRYLYTLLFHTRLPDEPRRARLRAVFDEVAASAQPIPEGGAAVGRGPDPGLLAHWLG